MFVWAENQTDWPARMSQLYNTFDISGLKYYLKPCSFSQLGDVIQVINTFLWP
jgi:hypothetical protein